MTQCASPKAQSALGTRAHEEENKNESDESIEQGLSRPQIMQSQLMTPQVIKGKGKRESVKKAVVSRISKLIRLREGARERLVNNTVGTS